MFYDPATLNIRTKGITHSLELYITGSLPAVSSGLVDITDRYPSIPSTARIGRMFDESSSPVLALLNPVYNVIDGNHAEMMPALLEAVAKNARGVLNVAQYGCGGASNVPFVTALMHERLSGMNFRGDVNFKNFDASPVVVDAVTNGYHPHYLEIRPLQFRDRAIMPRLESYHREYFVQTCKTYFDRMVNGYDTYLMKPEVLESISVELGDIRNMALEDNSQDMVFCFNVSFYLNEADQTIALNEVCRTLRDGGLFLTDNGILKKENNQLKLITGEGYPDGKGSAFLYQGLHPTYFDGADYRPFPIRSFGWNGDIHDIITPERKRDFWICRYIEK